MKPELELELELEHHIAQAIRLYEKTTGRRVASVEINRGGKGLRVRVRELAEESPLVDGGCRVN